MAKFDGLQVFSATMHHDRAVLGEKITDWIAARKHEIDIVEIEQLQSSDARFHCVTIVLYFKRRNVEQTVSTGTPPTRVKSIRSTGR